MSEEQNLKALTIKVPIDVHQRLGDWAQRNNSSLNAELIRSARERADREEVERISKTEREEFLSVRKDWASKIDPETAEFTSVYGSVCDPYGIYAPFEEDNVGRNYFVRAPGSDVWVLMEDLPQPIADAILQRNPADPITDFFSA